MKDWIEWTSSSAKSKRIDCDSEDEDADFNSVSEDKE